MRAGWTRADRIWVDWVPVAVLLLLSQVDPNIAESGLDPAPLQVGALALFTVLPLGWRRRYPLAVIGAITSTVVAWGVIVGPVLAFATFLSMMLATYSVAAHENLARAAIGAGAVATAVTVQALTDGQAGLANDWLFPVLYFGGVWLLGRAARRRDQRNRTLEALRRQLEQERDHRAQLAIAEERARIARELHDVISHGVGVMVVQAEAAAEVLLTDAGRAEKALVNIQLVGRQALTELRQMLGLLRHDEDDQPSKPQPSIADLGALIEQSADMGLSIDLTVDGDPRPLSAGLELSVYRIVQEALTNTRKHAKATNVNVVLNYRPAHIEVHVSDNGVVDQNSRVARDGHGLIGMRERVASYGGDLGAGYEHHGYAVRATLPTEPNP